MSRLSPRLTVVLPLLVGTLCAVASSAAEPAGRARVTLVGDSIAASIALAPRAERTLTSGLDLRLDARVCRRLVAPSCAFQGDAPSTALQSIRAAGRGLGDVLVVDVGYNESAQGYREGMRSVIRTALGQGARRVVWVTLREQRDVYRSINAVIRAEARAWPQVSVADWNAYSKQEAWFRRDGLHLTTRGAEEMATFLRPFVLRAVGL
jgi:hypothetical protein